MMTATRKTLKQPVSFRGRGVHTGWMSTCRLVPATTGGLRFLIASRELAVTPENVVHTFCGITLQDNGRHVQTPEHLLAALFLCGLTDVVIELDGFEVPILDGSATPFVEAIEKAGTVDLPRPVVQVLSLKKTIEVEQQNSKMTLSPALSLSVQVCLTGRHPLIGSQTAHYDAQSDDAKTTIAPARTYGFLRDHDTLKELGRANGSSENNTVIFTETGLYEGQVLRFQNEPARHKCLDLLGDFALLGQPLHARIEAVNPNHALTLAAIKQIPRN